MFYHDNGSVYLEVQEDMVCHGWSGRTRVYIANKTGAIKEELFQKFDLAVTSPLFGSIPEI